MTANTISITTLQLLKFATIFLMLFASSRDAMAGYDEEMVKIREGRMASEDVRVAADALDSELKATLSLIPNDMKSHLLEATAKRLESVRQEASQAHTADFGAASTALNLIELALSIHDLPNRDYEKTAALRAKAAQHFGSILAEFQTEAAKHDLDETQQWFVKTRFPHLIDEAQHNPLGIGTCYGMLLTETETSELKRLLTATLTPVEHKDMFQLGGDMNKNSFFIQSDAFHKVWFHIIHCEQSRLMAKAQVVSPAERLGRMYKIFNDKRIEAEKAESAARRKQFLDQVE